MPLTLDSSKRVRCASMLSKKDEKVKLSSCFFFFGRLFSTKIIGGQTSMHTDVI